MANIHFRERRLFSLFSSTFVTLLATMLLSRQWLITDGEIFTAMSQWEILIRLESNFVELLDEYIKKGEDGPMMKSLSIFLRGVKDRVEEAVIKPEEFASHPVNGFLIIKRFNTDWLELERMLSNKSVNGLSASINLHRPLFPSNEDLTGAIDGLFRLQDTYELSGQEIADGHLSKQYPNATMDTEDCFQVGLKAYHYKNYERAKEWMMVALNKFDHKVDSRYLTHRVLQEYIAWCEYETGNVNQALEIVKEILQKDPNHIPAKNNKIFFENIIKNNAEKKRSTTEKPKVETYMETYARLCRGETKQTPYNELAKLRCYYDNRRPQLMIKPAKVEVLNLQPRIVKYINVITDEEIETVKKLASPRLKRATINNLATGKLEFAKYRVSKSCWLEDHQHEVIGRLSKRIGTFTGLNTDWRYAEQMQVANYGIGGHYEPHWDHATNEIASILTMNNGNRIATFLIYMSDVESGGYTVFLKAEAVVKPTKGDAVFWYNLRRSGAGDSSTRHAACPVIVGSKWVSNKWIHSYGQEFYRKCGLEYDGLPGEKVLVMHGEADF